MSDVQRVGPVWGNGGSAAPFTAGISGQQRVSDAHGRYMDPGLGGRTFFASSAGAAPSAYVGGAAGTPLVAIHNPSNSGKILLPTMIGFALRAAGSAAGQTGLALWAGTSVQPTGTSTPARSAMSLTNTGSSMVTFVNTALTGSTALSLALPLFTYYWATAAAAFAAPGLFDVGGIQPILPGNQLALGVTVVPTSMTVDFSIYWEEVPALVVLG